MSIVDSKIVDKPWGSEVVWGDIQGVCIGKIIHINAGGRLSRQYHKDKEEAIYVISGTLRLEIGVDFDDNPEEILIGEPGFAYHIKPMTIHRFCSNDGPIVLCEISTYFPDDVIRLQDDYSRG